MNIKKTATMLSAAVLALALFAMASAECIKTPAKDGSLNVRKGPGTHYAVAGWVKNGQEITVLEWGADWSRIRVNASGVIGCVKSRYIASEPEGSEFIGAVYALGSVKTRYAASVVNVRKGPGTGYEAQAKAANGEGMRILGESGNWYLAELKDGTTGYISKNYVVPGIAAETVANVHIRTGAGTGFASKGVLAKGTELILTGVTGSWTEVQTDIGTGFVYSKYVK